MLWLELNNLGLMYKIWGSPAGGCKSYFWQKNFSASFDKFLKEGFALTPPSGPVQSSSCDVRLYVVCCMSPPHEIYHFRVLCRSLVEECIPNIGL